MIEINIHMCGGGGGGGTWQKIGRSILGGVVSGSNGQRISYISAHLVQYLCNCSWCTL